MFYYYYFILARLFSKKTSRYCHSPGRRRRRRRAKTLTFSNISVIIEDIYLKLGVVFSLSKGEPIPVGKVILHFFLTKLLFHF